MSQNFEFPKDFQPEYEKDFEVFGPTGPRIKVQLQYIGPLPEVGKPAQPEIFLYAIYQYGDRVEGGRLEWNPKNGPITDHEVAKALALQWNTHSPDSF